MKTSRISLTISASWRLPPWLLRLGRRLAALQLLGWQLSLGEDKRKPFEKSFGILGAIITPPEVGDHEILVTNKPSWSSQISDAVSELLELKGKRVSRTVLESLKGRLLCARSSLVSFCISMVAKDRAFSYPQTYWLRWRLL